MAPRERSKRELQEIEQNTNVIVPSFSFLRGWEPGQQSYTGPVRAFVSQRQVASRRLGRERRTPVHEEKQEVAHHGTSTDSRAELRHRSEQEQTPIANHPSRVEGTQLLHLQDNSSGSAHPPDLMPGHFQQGPGDPFDTLARPMHAFEVQSIDRFINQGYPWYGQYLPEANFQPARDIFASFSFSDPLTFDTVLSYGSGSLATATGDSNANRKALEYRGKVYRSLCQRLSTEADKPSVMLMICVCGIICACLETTLDLLDGSSSAIQTHVTGLRGLIVSSGGWREITVKSFPLSWLIIWADIRLNGTILQGLVPPPGILDVSAQDGLPTLVAFCTQTDTDQGVEELTCAYENLYTSASARRLKHSTPTTAQARMSPILLFQPGTLPYSVLRHKSTTRTQSEEINAESFAMYRRNLADVNLVDIPSNETLVWALLTDTVQRKITNIPVLETVMRLINTLGRLHVDTQERLADTLCDFMSLSSDGDVIGEKQWWEPDIFSQMVKKSILG